MANEDRRGVGTRLFVQGGEIVRKTFDQIGDSGRKMWAEIAAGEKTANPALKAVSRGVGEVKGGVSGLADQTGAAGRMLGSFGAAGVALAGVLGGLSVASIKAREAMAWADELGDAATKVQETASALYELRQANRLAGGEIEGADEALANFNKRLGDAQFGNKKALKVFEQLGFTREELQQVQKGSDLLPEFAERLQKLKTEAGRASVIERAGLGGIKPILEDANLSFDATIARVRALGLRVDDDLIRKGGDAQDQLETISEVIKLQFNEELIKSADLLVGVGNGMVTATKGAGSFFGQLRDGIPVIEAFLNKAPFLKRTIEILAQGGRNASGMSLIEGGINALGRAGRARALSGSIGDMLAGKPVSLQGTEWAPPPTPPRSLSGELGFPGGEAPKSKSTRVAGLTAEQKADLLEALAVEQRLAVARAAGNKVVEQQIEDEKFLAEQREKYIRAGVATDTARIMASSELGVRQFNRDAAAYRSSFKDPADFTSTADLMKPVLDAFDQGKRLSEEEQLRLSEDFGDAFASGLDAALHGDFWDFLEQELYRASLRGLSASVSQVFDGIMGRSEGLSGVLGKALGIAGSVFSFGGGRAAGGDMMDGYAFRAAEHDTELAMIGRSGRVFDHDSTKALLRDVVGGNGGVTVNATFAPTYGAIHGSGPEVAALRQQMAENEANFQARVVAAVNDGLQRRTIKG